MDVDQIELGRRRPLVGVLAALRMLPALIGQLLHRKAQPPAPKRMGLRAIAEMPASNGGWSLLAERPGQEIALGLVGRFWKPVIEYAPVVAEEFRDFSEPGYAKTVYALSVRPLQDGQSTLLSAVMRTATTDEYARRWFRRRLPGLLNTGRSRQAPGLRLDRP
jgi:hypothetical protein